MVGSAATKRGRAGRASPNMLDLGEPLRVTGTLAERVRDLLRRRGWQQSDLARESGISEATVSRLLGGEQRNPTAGTLRAIAKALKVPVDDLLVDDSNGQSDPLEASLLDFYRALPPDERAKIVDYAEALALRHQLTKNEKLSGRRLDRLRRLVSAAIDDEA